MYGPVPPHPPGFGPVVGPPAALAWGRGSATVGVGRDDQVSGEAVALELPPANLGLRILSGIVDVIVGVGLYVLLNWVFGSVFAQADSALKDALSTVAVVIAFVAVPTAAETATKGKNLGHLIVGLRTVRDDAGPVGFRHALARALIGVVEIYGCLGLPALFTAAITSKGKRMGDLVAGTYVIRDRRRLEIPDPVVMPAELATWASSADIGSLPAPLAVMLRRFLGHRENMRPQPRERLARQLIFDVAPFVSPAPPPAPDEAVLCAVMAERSRRDAARIERENRLRERLLR
ncbi:RDD family protein [Gordonia sp. NPDC003422]